MLRNLGEWINWTSSPQNEWSTWVTWQSNQPLIHYEKSDLYQYYLSYYPNFRPMENAVINGPGAKYYIYCFGDFAVFLVTPANGSNILEYILLLLNLYDTCKGVARRITGDPPCVTVLRTVVIRKSLEPLLAHDFSQYNYNYEIIHAHTVVQYSLSTLIMRFISNYLSYVCPQQKFPFIHINLCQKAYHEKRFGITPTPAVTTSLPNISSTLYPQVSFAQTLPPQTSLPQSSFPVDIIQDIKRQESPKSWPRDQSSMMRCSKCNRVTENIWGNFKSCLDCHVKRICSECGLTAVIIGPDELPKCVLHQKSTVT